MGNPLAAEVEPRANAFGKRGWELAAIDAGVWIFKRLASQEAGANGALEAIIEETVPVAETAILMTPIGHTPTAGGS